MVTTTTALAATVLTLAAFAALGVAYSRGRVGDIESFLTARDTAGAGTLTATLIASSMGAWILFAPAEAGAAFGGLAAVLGYALGSAIPLLAYAHLGPRIRQLIPEGHSLTEYARARYGRAMHAYVLCVSVAYMFVFLAAELTGITGALALVAGVPAWQTAALVGGFVLLYTGYGGLTASMVTDTAQTLVLLPLLAVGFAGGILALGGPSEVHAAVAASNPQLLSPGFLPGVTFGVYVAVAILGAEMLNQAWWQRIYAAQDDATLTRAFRVAAVAVVPMVLLAGLFGVAAAGLGVVGEGEASIAFFLLVSEAFPEWVVLAVVLVAVLLVASTADTLFNAISSLVTADLSRLLDSPSDATLTRSARALTAVVALAAAFVGAQGYSVLAVFLTADLLAAATFVPLLAGLYTPRLTGTGALASALAGLLAGVALFPLTPVALPLPRSFFNAFLAAAGVSALLTVVATRLSTARFDTARLADAGALEVGDD
ncbi:sodium:solute symporter family transporter [Natronomonas sp. EA1]|uniref:sodium:solute symporter family transporter n=1 Tax=Natronomonas sp. EA1 TaxID=3421655 RepID=UPI003EB85B9F